jgi:CSLREA domain-containing protein
MSTNLSVLNKALFGVSLMVASLLMLFWLALPTQAQSTITVDTTNDVLDTSDNSGGTSDGHCSLREAITAANTDAAYDVCAAGSGEDTIVFNVDSPATITLDSMLGQLPTITDGDGLTIDGGSADITVSGNDMVRVFAVGESTLSAAQLTLKNLTVADGFATVSDPVGGQHGAGLLVLGGTATVTNSTFSGNTVSSDTHGTGGGALYNQATLTVTNSTFTDNSANGKITHDIRCEGLGIGGAIYGQDGAQTEVSNSTFSSNSATSVGGAIYNAGTLTLTGSTFSGNSASVSYEPPNDTPNCSTTVEGNGGAVYALANQTTIRNTIVANSPAGGNCFGVGGPFTNGGYNIDDGTTCGFSASTSKSNTDPKLGASGLQDNGGPTKTIALQSTSPAIDQGNRFGATTDQRGESRPHDFPDIANATGGDGSDIGAFEVQLPPELSIDDATVTEGTTPEAVFTVRLTKPSAQTVTVDFATTGGTASAGSDYQATSGTLTFAPRVTSQEVHVTINDDVVDESDETFFVNLGNAANATVSDAQGIGTITDNDPPPDTTPPSVSCSASPNKLRNSANNHKLVTITTSVSVTDSGSGANGFKLVSVASNQADSGLGTGDVPNDIQRWNVGEADTSGQLRAERYRTDRIYTLTYEGEDKAGNKKTCSATVRVSKG